jgi:CBS domain containing-hemolysin-like protein
MDYSFYTLIILLSLLFSAFFSGMEIAFLSSNRLKIELDRHKGTFNGKVMGRFYKKESFFIALLLLGNNTALVLFGIYAAKILEPIIENWGILEPALILIIQTILSTLLVLVVSEFLPKALVQINPNGFLRIATTPMLLIYSVLYLPTQLVMFVSGLFLRLLKTDRSNSAKVFSIVDLEHYVQDISARIKEEQDFGNEMQILQNALDFRTIKARDCMVPRTEIIAIEVDEAIERLNKLFIDNGLSKIIVYRKTIDNIIGYVHSFELFKSPVSIKQILLPIAFVPSAMPGKELLELFTKQAGNIAVVVDEYGGTAGIVTIEDVVEEIFGEIEDEHDVEDLLEEKISEDSYRFSARLEIDYLNNEYGFDLPESDEYETLGGFIIHQLETIPALGEIIELENSTLEIEKVSDRRIEVVCLKINE